MKLGRVNSRPSHHHMKNAELSVLVSTCVSAQMHLRDSAGDIIYINWLNMARSGLLALEFYSPETGALRQVYKSTTDVESGKRLYDFYSDVNDRDAPDFLSLRSVVLARKQPMKMFVQHNTVVDGNKGTLKKYDSSPEGLVQSFVDLFSSTDIDSILRELWDRDKPFFTE